MPQDYWVRQDADGFSAMLGSEVLQDEFECQADASDFITAYLEPDEDE